MRYDLSKEFVPDSGGRYGKTFVLVSTKEKEKKLCWVDSAGTEYFVFYDESLNKSIYEHGTVKEGTVFFETFLPESGWLQNGRHSFYLAKLSNRQWKRSLCSGTHKFFSADNPNTRGEVTRTPRFSGDSCPTFAEMFKKTTFEFGEAVTLLTKGDWYSCVLGNDLCLSREGLLFLKNDIIGKVNFAKRTFKYNRLFTDEVNAVVRTTQFLDVSKTDEDSE